MRKLRHWCSHIKIENGDSVTIRPQFYTLYVPSLREDGSGWFVDIPDKWRCCPICKIERPQ